MKTVMTLITFLAVISIGSFTHAESKSNQATKQAVQEKEIKDIPTPVSVPRISEDVFSYDPDDC